MDYYQIQELKRIRGEALSIASDLSSLKHEVIREQKDNEDEADLNGMFANLISATEKATRVIERYGLDEEI